MNQTARVEFQRRCWQSTGLDCIEAVRPRLPAVGCVLAPKLLLYSPIMAQEKLNPAASHAPSLSVNGKHGLACASALTAWLRLMLALSVAALAVQGGEQVIRLRNEAIVTPDRPAFLVAPQNLAAEMPASGLFLVQMENVLDERQKSQLQALGVELLRYVPDHAFVARLRQTRLSSLRSLPFVRWSGVYQASYKIHRGLRNVATTGPTNAWLQVRALVAQDCSPLDLLLTRRMMGQVRHQSATRIGTILQGQVLPDQLERLAASTNVLWIEPAPRPKLLDEIASKIVAGESITGYADSHAAAVHQLGFDGRDVVVAVADSGLDSGDAETMHPDLAGRVDVLLYYGQLEDAADEHSHGTHVAGIIAGNGATGENDGGGSGTDLFGLGGDLTDPTDTGGDIAPSRPPALYGLGVAPKAHIVAQRIFDGSGNFEAPDSNESLTHDAVRAGAVIGSNSWGDDVQGRYDLNAAEFDALVRDADASVPGDQPYILEFSAGNAGPGAQTMDSPAVAKNVIATGASQNDRTDLFIYTDGPEAMADFSSRGPCEDGRIKPDLTAPGTWIASLQSASASDANAWLPISQYYQYQGGTSQAGPHVSGAAAVFVQYYRQTHSGRTPSPALVKAALINSCTDMVDDQGGTTPIPNFDEGWGRVTLTNLIGSTRRFQFVDQTAVLTNTQVYEQRVLCGSPYQPLKITLTYTDVPGLPAALPALVNDLDLEVIAPDGHLFRGNQFAEGESIPDPPKPDAINNVEGVHLNRPLPGEYVVRVRGSRIVEDIHRAPTAAPSQDFALVVSGDLAAPGQGIVYFDRGAYRAGDSVRVALVDFDLAGQAAAIVRVHSTTEPQGESVSLSAVGSSGIFAGTLNLATGAAAADGRLQVKDGDTIEAAYQDASSSQERLATARVDMQPPTIGEVTITPRYGVVTVDWITDEPARSRIYYRSNGVFVSTNSLFSLSETHEVTLNGLAPGVQYQFYLVAEDEAGNISTNDNQGQFFAFAPQRAATVLLVDAFNDILLNDFIPVTTYTDALDGTGVSYDVWDLQALGKTPTLDNLKPYRVVIWRVPELNAAITDTDARNILDYLNGGGSLFIASMELLSRLDESGLNNFARNALHVDSFLPDQDVKAIVGLSSSSLTSGLNLELDFSQWPDFFGFLDLTTGSDTFTPGTNAAPILLDQASLLPVGLRYPRPGTEAPGHVIFFSFPFDTVPLDGPVANNRVDLLREILSFLAPGSVPLASLELDRESYSLPALVTIEVTDIRLSGTAQVLVEAVNTRSHLTNQVPLQATPQPGVFVGSLVLSTPDTNQPGLRLVAQNGDEISFSYRDQSAARTLLLTAFVDTGIPTITNILATPDYGDAVISWTTSEPADSLVQFDDAEFRFNVNRTAYDGQFTTEHSVLLSDLQPDRDYYFKVVSRDPAGNTVAEDNQGLLFSFRTLKPIQAPFADNFEAGATNWQVVAAITDDATLSLFTTLSWELGAPNNSLAKETHSGAACWGTNLRGDAGDFAANDLVSPAIQLVGGNNATLQFWHNYDFIEPDTEFGFTTEAAGVFISTNNGAAWIGLTAYTNASEGWELEQIDLTPYLGLVIRLAWHYELFSFGTDPRPGWLVDDVSISVTNIIPGTVMVSNNLAQAAFTLEGAAHRQGRGLLAVYTNLPPGDYTITYQELSFYQAPPPQTLSLASRTTNLITGVYSFPDANRNLISDLWESNYFGRLLPEGTTNSDSDHDGATDYQEFRAGTNPTNAASVTTLTLPYRPYANALQLNWLAATGLAYRIEVSTNLVQWFPLTDWMRAIRTNVSQTLTVPTNSPAYLFRLRVQP
jgi:hypothetical protein